MTRDIVFGRLLRISMQMHFPITYTHPLFHSQVPCLRLILWRKWFHFQPLTLSLCPPVLPLLSLLSLALRQTGSVRSGQVISGLIGRLMFLQKPGTLTCLLSSLVHFLSNGKSQTCWRLTETQTTVLFEDFQPIKCRDDTAVISSIIGGGGNHKQAKVLKNWLLVLSIFISHDSIAQDLPMTRAIEMLKGKEYPWMGWKNRGIGPS